ncbi:MAG: nitronate monooxygenase [Oscillospiraceae bacterium]|nr:nitronate monooxygenase [Oscillospiraceae bacterium]
MKIKGIKIGNKVSKYPIIQGGMGIGVSAHNLAGAVAKNGGIGVIASVNIGYKEKDFLEDPLKANLRAIDKEIDQAREIAGKDGIIGVNIMVAIQQYSQMVKQAVKKGVDLIISGAGLPKNLPEYVKNTKTKIAPIISSAKGAELIIKLWMKRYNYVPDMIVVEGPEAGGHLGFSEKELDETKRPKLENIIVEVIKVVKNIEKTVKKKIPVIAAGGIFSGKDIARFLKLGASGVQMATRFVTTKECDASDEFKKAYIESTKEDIKIIKSPVGMPGRAIRNNFIKKVENERVKSKHCVSCIIPCNPRETPYCISDALINAVKGNTAEGLVFCGSNVDKVKELVTVKELMNELVGEMQVAMA